MPPPDAPIEVITKYLDDNVSNASYWPALRGFLSGVLDRGLMNSWEFFGHIQLPNTLRAAEVDEFRAFLDVMLKYPGCRPLLVPDGNLRFTPVSQLYDHSIPLLSSAFKNSEATSFVHSSLWDLQTSLRFYGLQYEITFSVFLTCAREIDRQAHNSDDALDAAEKAYAYYSSELLHEIGANEWKWERLASLRFIPRMAERRTYLDQVYDVTTYCEALPAVVAPGNLLRRGFEAIAWTQRGLFCKEPPIDLIYVNPTLGEPRVEEVVCLGGIICVPNFALMI
jgi:hypothetical protein